MKHKSLLVLYLLTAAPYCLAITTENTIDTNDYDENEISSLQKDNYKKLHKLLITLKERGVAPEKRLVALVLAYFFGAFGAHRFYVGKNVTAVLQLLTLGGLGIWQLIDILIILFGEFTNVDGERLVEWT